MKRSPPGMCVTLSLAPVLSAPRSQPPTPAVWLAKEGTSGVPRAHGIGTGTDVPETVADGASFQTEMENGA